MKSRVKPHVLKIMFILIPHIRRSILLPGASCLTGHALNFERTFWCWETLACIYILCLTFSKAISFNKHLLEAIAQPMISTT